MTIMESNETILGIRTEFETQHIKKVNLRATLMQITRMHTIITTAIILKQEDTGQTLGSIINNKIWIVNWFSVYKHFQFKRPTKINKLLTKFVS